MIEQMRTSLIFVLAVASLAAQHNHPGPPPTEKPVTLLSGLGVYSHRIATSNAEAQKFFDQGLNLLYGFNRYEALRSFRKAAELDPTAVMPLWGVAMALGPHINMDMDGDVNLKDGCQALAKARTLTASAYERGYVESAASRCPEYKPKAYSDAIRQLYDRNPDDLDAATLFVESLMIPVRWKWWNVDGSPAGEMSKAVQILEQVMRRNPDHPGANHFYIHAVEMSPSPERAIPSAQRLMGIVPSAGHLVHMPAHIWVILGDWETAATVNERAAEVDREYFAQTGVQSGYIGYYVHNLHFVAYSRAMQGRANDAIAASDLIAKEAAPAIESMSEMIDSFIAYPTFIRVRFGRWDEILAGSRPPDKLLASTAVWHWSRALAYTAKGDSAAASREADLFRAAKSRVPATWPWVNNKAAEMLALADIVLEARRSRNDAAATEHWRRAVDLQDRLVYDEPPPWYMPLRESLGGSLLRAGQANRAELVFREGLRRSPRNGRMLFGLMKSLEAQNKKEATDFVRQEFERSWKNADVKLRVEDL
jgi:tetratricopeptide (TPR) repeat protein